MKSSKGAAMVLLAAIVASPSTLAADVAFAWPDGRKAAVSLAYDDALDSQLDNAIPALDKHGFKATFYLPLGRGSVGGRLVEWRNAALKGHELGNHTLFHQCSGSAPGREWVEPQRDLDKTPVMAMKDQVLLANTMLNAIDGERERTLAVPCGESMAADGNYIDLVKAEFVAIKLGDGAVPLDMHVLDPHAVGVWAPEGASGEDLIARVEEAASKGTMVNLTFHGIGGDYLTVSGEAHQQLLEYLASRQDIYWVDTFINLMRYVRRQQALVKHTSVAH